MIDSSDRGFLRVESQGYYFWREPFAGYAVQTNQTGPGFYAFVFVYTLLAFIIIAPLVKWSRQLEDNKIKQLEKDSEQPTQPAEAEDGLSPHEIPTPVATNSSSEDIAEKQDMSMEQKRSSNVSDVPGKSDYSSNHTTGKQVSPSKSIPFKKSNRPKSLSVTTTGSRSSSVLRSVVLRELDQSYPDQDPDFQMACFRHSLYARGGNQFPSHRPHATSQLQQARKKSKEPTDTSSGVPSVATTSKVFLRNPSQKKFSTQVLDVSGRRWKTRRPIGRIDVIQNTVASELSSLASNGDGASAFLAYNRSFQGASGGEGEGSFVGPNCQKGNSVASSNSKILAASGSRRPRYTRQRGLSDVASSILSEQHHQLHQQPQVHVDLSLMKTHHQLEPFHLQQLQFHHEQQHPFVMHRIASLQRHQQQQRYIHGARRSVRSGRSVASERSAMSSIVDDISPNDAADANDPGRGNVFIEPDAIYLEKARKKSYGNTGFGIRAGCCSSPLEEMLSLAMLDEDKRRVLISSIPLTLGASSEALFRLITTAFISQYLGTDSMIAFVLVGLFVRLTSEELADAIIDALSAFVQASMYTPTPAGEEIGSGLSSPNSFLAGQYIQLAFLLQLLLNVPLLLMWVFVMERVVLWFVGAPTIAAIAQDYAFVVVFSYIVQSLTRTLTVAFHICGHDHFESVIDFVASTLQLVSIASVVALVDNASLVTVGYVQVLITAAAAIAKILYPVVRGWMQPFRKGLIQNVALLQNKVGIWHLLKAAGPLLLGTILEYGEWELLTIFVRHLGPAEVATWALLGAFWDVLEALTEGIGEAAANQVAFLLSTGLIERAKSLSWGVINLALIQALILTSALYMSGQYLAILFTADPTIQHLIDKTIVWIGFANVTMSFAQITWSLVGAQGRFRLATLAIFLSRWLVSIPCALLSIYVFFLDLNAVSGSLVVGYATATSALMFIVLRSDWERLADTMQEINQPPPVDLELEEGGVGEAEKVGLGFVNLDDFDDSDDSDSDGF
ncbi:MATE efflux family protein [Nitzschia inconspicua]|uniref:MATE efflux family protein n=1 Tax=Nitzschia inconspicua TaxID=303405 RepID=A0A9K3KEY8_9STRA|nr:MATE efflux family protein [Nitzschia inconspicua]